MPLPVHVRERPDKPAVVMASSGAQLTFGELETRSLQFAQLLDAEGVSADGKVALLLGNNIRHYEVYWGALRSGRFITPLNTALSPAEIAYIVNDSGAEVMVTSPMWADQAQAVASLIDGCRLRLIIDGDLPGWQRYEPLLAEQPATVRPMEPLGDAMSYSSGTTGRPKGIRRFSNSNRTLADGQLIETEWTHLGLNSDTMYLSTAALYHGAPMSWTAMVQSLGGTVILMEKFDPLWALELIEKHRITVAQFVPTHFIRMLRLSPEDRARFDLSSLKVVVHAAAPCPPEVKRDIIDWLGPIVVEYYGSTERIGRTEIDSPEWLDHPGSVGPPQDLGVAHLRPR